MGERWLIGVDLGGTTTKLAFINDGGEILNKWEIPTDNSNEGENITKNIGRAIENKLQELGQNREKIKGIGMGAPGPVNYKTGSLYNTVNLGWRDNYPLKAELEAETLLPVVIENDANCAAIGEMWKGVGNGAENIVCVTLGTGVGGGVIAGGDIVQGASGAAGEIGHITSVAEGGAMCNCGKTGCLETIASATGIVRQAMEILNENESHVGELANKYRQNREISAKDIFDAAKNGDELAHSIIKNTAFHLGLALANIGNTLNPDKIVLGGGVSKAGDILLKPVKENFKKFAFPRVGQSTIIDLAILGNDAGVIGAAWLAKNK
ncbi:ROK family glucokinase [Bacillus sp. FJAT-29790]|uniref:ROK family glucokinase n=1 Tax=Bacillus sp. FJAT-29790 TaxID=1895002 RepID=UPI001C213FF9|nr:ROK family glucokinase [Bacillus sp. FJAT-29790]MBU8879381.1 ROK family glucokinase [Bacillus sp. FJAT-29790]